MHAKCQHHLALPERQGIGKGGLNPFHQQTVVVLEQPDLRRHLNGDLAGQLQVMQLLFKPVALGGEVVRLLGVHRVTAGLGLGLQRFQVVLADLGKLLVARNDVESQLVEVVVVLVIQAVKHGDVLEQLRLVSFQGIGDVLNVHGHLVIPRLHPGNLVLCLGEDLRQTLRLLGILLEAFQLGNEVHQHVPDLAGILRLDGVKGGLREIGDLSLRVGTVEQYVIRVADVHLGDEIVDRFFLSFGQLAVVKPGSGFRFGGRCSLLNALGHSGGGFGFRRAGGSGELEHGIGFRHCGVPP